MVIVDDAAESSEQDDRCSMATRGLVMSSSNVEHETEDLILAL